MTEDRGLWEKYEIRRTDGRDEPGGPHERCNLFVLDLSHDAHARTAAAVYADAVEAERPNLAADLRACIESESRHD